jgi:hypothetical protein
MEFKYYTMFQTSFKTEVLLNIAVMLLSCTVRNLTGIPTIHTAVFRDFTQSLLPIAGIVL